MIALEMILAKSSKGNNFIRERNNDNINRNFQQEEVQPSMHAHMMIVNTHIGIVFRKYIIQSIEFKFKIL